jgi:hypothetical protein
MFSLHDKSQHLTGFITGHIVDVGHLLISVLQLLSKLQLIREGFEQEFDWPIEGLSQLQ